MSGAARHLVAWRNSYGAVLVRLKPDTTDAIVPVRLKPDTTMDGAG